MSTTTESAVIDFDISVLKGGEGVYRIIAQTSSNQRPDGGGARGVLDWKALRDDDFVDKVRQIREEPHTVREGLFKEIGQVLFAALFQGDVRDLFVGVFRQRVQGQADAYLRLRLDIEQAALEVAELPWEFMVWEGMFLALESKILVTRRYRDLPLGPSKTLVIDQPKVLVFIPGGSGLKTAQEEANIRQALASAGVSFDVLKDKVTQQLLDDALARGRYHVLHFIGHGKFESDIEDQRHGALRFNRPGEVLPGEKDEEWIKDEHLEVLLRTHADYLRLVVLNACHGGEQGERSSGRGFIGVAPAVLRAQIPAVVAMQYAIKDSVAVEFARVFYDRLTQSEWAGRVDIAVNLARNACYRFAPDDRGFGTPILYLHASDAALWTRSESSPSRKEPTPPPPPPVDCSQPPRPDEFLLEEKRHEGPEILLAEANSLRDRVGILARRLAAMEKNRDEKPWTDTDGSLSLQIEDVGKQKKELERKKEELQAILCWKLYEACLQRAELRQELDKLEAERARLEREGRYLPYSLRNEITDRQRKLRDLDELLKQGEAYCQP